MTPFRSRPARAAVVAALAALAIPSQAFACWSTCVGTFGYYSNIGGSTFFLDHCTESWPDGSSGSHITCYYRRLYT